MVRLCRACGTRQVPEGRRVYCDPCGETASTRLKREYRREHARAWRESDARLKWASGSTDVQPPWLDGWASAEARRAYYRAYMQRWRARRRAELRTATVSASMSVETLP